MVRRSSVCRNPPVFTIASSIVDRARDQFRALFPPHHDAHPRLSLPRIPDRMIFDKFLKGLVFGCASWRIADDDCSPTILRRRRDARIAAGVMDHLATVVKATHDRMIGLDRAELAVDGGITDAPRGELAGRSPVNRGKQGRKRSTVVEGAGIALGTVVAPAARHDTPLLEPTLDLLDRFISFPEPPTIHCDGGHDFPGTPDRLAQRKFIGDISPKGKPAPVPSGFWDLRVTPPILKLAELKRHRTRRSRRPEPRRWCCYC